MAAKRLVPLLDRVLVEKLAPPTKTTGGVLLPETASKVRRRMPACRCF
jgi:chaperonin GroES